MSFRAFQRAEGRPGYLYELSGGVIEVTDIRGREHAAVRFAVCEQLDAYRVAHPGVIKYMAGAADAKTELPALESERHPDVSIYLTPMPEDPYPWDKWLPSIVIEVVSPGAVARRRDYQTKRREYLSAGILEYWIVDPQQLSMLALTRHGDTWREKRLGATGSWTTSLLPGFELRLRVVFAALGRSR